MTSLSLQQTKKNNNNHKQIDTKCYATANEEPKQTREDGPKMHQEDGCVLIGKFQAYLRGF
jgi:hypothetical protein